MRCLRLVTLSLVLCGLVGAAHADFFRVLNPADVPGPAVRDFGSVRAGQTSDATVQLSGCNGTRPSPDVGTCNGGGGQSTVQAWSFGNGCAEFSAVSPSVPRSMDNGTANAVTFTFRYAPVDRGVDTCVVTTTLAPVPGDDTATSFTLTGTGTASLLAIDTASPLGFADQPYNAVPGGQTQTITFRNSGNLAIAEANLTVSIDDATHFALGAITPAVGGFPIDPGETATVAVTFNPTSIGNKSAIVTFSATNDLGSDPSPQITVSGKGTQSIATVPASVVFAPGAVNLARTANLEVMNTGDGPLNLTNLSIAVGGQLNGTNFAFTDHGCSGQSCVPNGNPIPAGMSTTFVLSCTPSAAGLRAAVLTISSDDGTAPSRTVVLKCTGNDLDLGTDKVGAPATGPQNVAIANGTGAALTYSVASSAPAEFAVTCAGGCANRMLAAGASETVAVTFQAAAAGNRAATLTFTTSDADTTGQAVDLTGTGLEPTIAVAPSPLAFGDVPVVEVGGATQAVTITNGGLASLVISGMSITDDLAGNFSFATVACPDGQTCNDTITVDPGAPPANQTTVTLRCDPTTGGDKTANLVITSDAPTSPTTVPLTCTGTVPDVVVSTGLVAFGGQRVGTTSAASTFTVANSDAAHTAPMAYTISLPAGTQFAMSCSAPGCSGTLDAGESVTVSVTFSPTSAGAKSATITVAAPDDPDEAMTEVDLTGTGTEPTIAVAPSPLAFGDVPVAQAGGATTGLTVTNGGGAPLVISSMTIAGDPENSFSFATVACPGGQSCVDQLTVNNGSPPANQATVTLRCDPTTGGDKAATLTIVSDAPTSPTSVPLTCTGTVPDVSVTEMMLAFGDQRVGTTSLQRSFFLSNAGAAHTAPLPYSVTEDSPDFDLVCAAPGCVGTLAAGEMIEVFVTFTPGSTGVKLANVTIATAADPDEPTTLVMLSGTGTQPSVVVDAPAAPPLALGDVDVNATSAPGTVTIRNSGTADLAISAVTLIGADAAQFTITGGGTGPQTLSSSGGMNTHGWTVTCTPTSIGVKTASLRITHDAPAPGTNLDVALTCTGRAAIFTASVIAPTTIDFGQVQVNTDSAPRSFTFTNTGNKAGRVTMLTSTANTFVPTTMANLAQDIAPGDRITVDVVFHPVNTLVVTEQVCGLNTGLIPTVCVTVTGDGQSIGLDLSPPIDFGAVRFDAAPVTSAPVTIRNTGESSLRIDSITSAGAPFTIVNGPALPVTLGLNDSRVFNVRLTPTPALGTVTRTVTVGGVFTVSGAAAQATIDVTARITAPQVAMTADSIDFGPFDVDDPGTAVTRSLMITNTGDLATGSDLHLGAPVLTAGAPDFALAGLSSGTVAPGASATLMVRFDPTTAGTKTGQITIPIDALTGMTYTVTLRGLAIDQNVVCNPGTITFPATVRRQASAPQDATVTNLDFATGMGTAAMLDYTATITGANAGDFALAPGADAGTIAGNAMKALPVTFTPSAAGTARTADLVITYNDAGPRSCMVRLSGDGRLRQVSAAPMDVDFGTVAVGSTVLLSEVASALQLTSNEPAGATATMVTKVEATGAAADAFVVVGGATPQPLPMGGRVTYDVEFSPGEPGVFQADLAVFLDDDPEAQYTIHVSGRAVALDLHGGGCNSGSGGAGAGLAAGLAALGLVLARRRRRRDRAQA